MTTVVQDTSPVVTLRGEPLDAAALFLVAEGRARLAVAPEALVRVGRARLALEAAIASGVPVYGANTGVGGMKNRMFGDSELADFNDGLIRAHSFGVGEPLPESVVRMAIVIRANTALVGATGCTPDLIMALLSLLERDCVPLVRHQGSVGCADIGLMGQIGAVLTGEGEVMAAGQAVPALEGLARAGLTPMRMRPRDSLALLSSNAVGVAMSFAALRRSAAALRLMLWTALATSTALAGSPKPWRAAASLACPTSKRVVAWLREALGWPSPDMNGWPTSQSVHDPLSQRMMAEIFAAAFDAIAEAAEEARIRTALVDDNPVVIDDEVLTSGGSLPLRLAVKMQSAMLALAHVARNAQNRCILLVNGDMAGLPVNLTPPGVVATGFGPLAKLAVEAAARAAMLAHPVSAYGVTMARGMEDEATFLPLAAERLSIQARKLARLTAVEAILSAQAVEISGAPRSGAVVDLFELVRARCAFLTKDRALSRDVMAVEEALLAPETLDELVLRHPFPEFDRACGLAASRDRSG
jgi:histidine ammonia-lyase